MSRDQEALIDILAAIKLILQYTEGQDFAALKANSEKKLHYSPLITRHPLLATMAQD